MGWFNIIKQDEFWQFLTSLAGNAELAFGLEGTIHDVDAATQQRIHRMVELVTTELEELGPSEDLTELERLTQIRIIRLVNNNLQRPEDVIAREPEGDALPDFRYGGVIDWIRRWRP